MFFVFCFFANSSVWLGGDIATNTLCFTSHKKSDWKQTFWQLYSCHPQKQKKSRGELKYCYVHGEKGEKFKNYKCEKRGGGTWIVGGFLKELPVWRKGCDYEFFRRWSYTGGREPLSLFTGEGCILVWHASGDVFGFFFLCVLYRVGRCDPGAPCLCGTESPNVTLAQYGAPAHAPRGRRGEQCSPGQYSRWIIRGDDIPSMACVPVPTGREK